ncbi:MAG: hypothetical protein ACFFE2_13060 [Candidatus Thorarchaeota archaeon]
MTTSLNILSLTERLIVSVYPELQQASVSVSWGKTSSFAQIEWDDVVGSISIRINNEVKAWPEACVIGLISHELSHPSQKRGKTSELKTDMDSISRGLGPFLAVERLFAGKYEDHMILHGKDRYLGYASIRVELTEIELQHLDALLSELHLIPSKPPNPISMNHDVAIVNNVRERTVTIQGYKFMLPKSMENPDIKLLERNNVTYVYADEIMIGEFEMKED